MLPFFKAIPPSAVYPVLVIVGFLMFTELGKIDLSHTDTATAAASFFTVVMMPLSFSITDGLATGFILYSSLKIVQGDLRAIDPGIGVITLISLIAMIVR
jgi:AGZA family xanthine/uracil permease-like MFS transporter